MSVADRLGTGSSFGGVPRGRSARGRAKALVQGDVPAYELSRIRLEDVAPTPLNPRRNFGSDEELTRFGEELRNTQLAACVAISRAAYLKVWPQHEAQIGDAQYVLINGERRYRSASHVGLESLDFVVRDDLAVSREAFIDHLLKENLEREDFDVIERARGVQQLVLVCSEESATGARARAAKRLGRDRSWVTNQLSLLELPEDLQLMLSSGSLAERDGRMLARRLKDHPGMDSPQLLAYLKEYRERDSRVREEAKALAEQAKQKLAAEEVPQQKTAEPAAAEEVDGADDFAFDSDEAVGAVGERDVLSADNNADRPSGEPDRETPGNTPAPVRETPAVPRPVNPAPTVGAPTSTSTPAAAPAPARVPVAVSPPAAREQARDDAELLSADNNSGARTPDESVRGLVRQLGATPKEQARALAAGLSHDELVALIEELHAYR
ncbi:ParB/RepB/Spo0J family partition protein [Streptomyces sp. NPDC058657]|uniref:ParB/RepB/Spo0J family partition protein n=1 Tax=unclassified Streptomyces TaxID=2593676 RepID=UPI0036616547